MSIWSRAKSPLENSGALFARDHWKGGLFVAMWAPPVFRLADLLRERIEG